MIARDEWLVGWREALDFRTGFARAAWLRMYGPTWSAERMRGYLECAEYMEISARCTCRGCPVHGSVASEPQPFAAKSAEELN